MLLDGPPSWRQRGRPQPVNQAQNLSEQSSGDSDFRELKGDIPAMSHDLRADLDQLLTQRGQRPVPDFPRQGESPVLMLWTAPPPASRCAKIAVAVAEPRESAYGTKPKFGGATF